MKIIHTSDWHLGKRLEGRSRLPEQARALEDLARLAADEKASAVVIAGDVYDTVNPPADAEALFYETALSIGRVCPVIAVAGNHDNPARLSAPQGIASACGILLAGGLDFRGARAPFEGGEGYVRLRHGGEVVNLAILPYPSRARISELGYDMPTEMSYTEAVRAWLSRCAEGFTASDCNILVSHLFMQGCVRSSDEIELGTAALLPTDILPQAHYTALGHIHKPQCVSRKQSVYYSGSLLSYAFDDETEKFYNVVETSPVGVTMRQAPVKGGKRLVTVRVADYDEAVRALRDHEGAYVRLLYDCALPLSASRYAELRGFDAFTSLVNVYVSPRVQRRSLALRGAGELFAEFYKAKRGEEPSDEMKDIFEKALRGETTI